MSAAEDREKVRELFARYCHEIDDPGRHNDWVTLFTPGAVLTSNVSDRLDGLDGLSTLTNNMAAIASSGVQSRHVIDNLSMTLGKDSGKTEGTLCVFNTVHGETALFLVGIYRSKVRKVGDSWLFETLDLQVDTNIGQAAADA